MPEKQSFIYQWLLLFIFLVTGCKVMITNYDEDELGFSDTPEIISYAITDSYNQTTNDRDFKLQINAGILGGEFGVSYYINDDAYSVSLAVNNTNVSDGALIFYSGICGSSACTVNMSCRSTNSVTMYCGVVSADNPEVDVSSIVTAIPMDAYLILQVCNSDHSTCSESYQLVELQ